MRLFALLLAGWCLIGSAAPAGVLRIGNGAEPRDLDPQLVTGIPEFRILEALFEGLTSRDSHTSEPIPGIAESWTRSIDGKTYTFKLRQARWSNGEPVTARDFVYAWTRLLDPRTGSEYASQGFYFKNGKAFYDGKLKDASRLGFKAVDDRTLLVTLESNTPFFLGLLFTPPLYPVPRAVIEKHGPKWTRPENMVSNGPFVLAKWQMGSVLQLKKNLSYWDQLAVKLNEAHFFPTSKVETEEAMFRAGALDLTNDVPLEKIPGWQKDTSGVYQQAPYLGTYFYWLNVGRAPFDKKTVRQALNLAIDRQRLVTYVMRAGQVPGTSLTPPGCGGGYQPPKALPNADGKITEARALLAKAGYPEGRGFPPIEVLYNTSDNQRKIAEVLQQMWKKNLGIQVTLVNQEWKVYLDSKRTKNFQVCRAGWIGDYNDPNSFLEIFTSQSLTNYSNWRNDDYDRLIGTAREELDPAKRLQLFAQAEAILLDELPVIPIYLSSKVYLKAKRVQGWHPNLEDIHPLKFVSVSP